MPKNVMPTRAESFAIATATATAANAPDRTQRLWKIQEEMERRGFSYDPTKGHPDVESAYSQS